MMVGMSSFFSHFRRTLIIAEAGVNHNGDFNMAMQLIDAAAEAGADAVKFQLFDPDEICGDDSPLASYQGKTESSQKEMLRRLTLPRDAYENLKRHAETKGLLFIVTPFDVASAQYLATLGVRVLKIPSGEITNIPFLKAVAALGLPVILSTGTSSMDEVEEAVRIFTDAGTDLAILHCTSSYPTPFDQVNLRAMQTLAEKFSTPVGLSDHTEGVAVPIAAVALGATIIEKHFTLDRTLPGPDHKASVEPEELRQMVNGIRAVEQAMGSAEKKRQPAEQDTAAVARRSVVAARDLKVGDVLTKDMLAIKRPGTGIPPKEIDRTVGRVMAKDVKAGTPLVPDDLQ